MPKWQLLTRKGKVTVAEFTDDGRKTGVANNASGCSWLNRAPVRLNGGTWRCHHQESLVGREDRGCRRVGPA